MTVKWVEENGTLGAAAPRANIEIIKGAQVVEPQTAGFVVNKLANMGWRFVDDSSSDPSIPKGIVLFETTVDIPASNPVRGMEARTALDLLKVLALSANQSSAPIEGELPPGSLVAVDLANALGPANFSFFTVNSQFGVTEAQLNDTIGEGEDFALLGTDVNEPPLSLPFPLSTGGPPIPAEPPPPGTSPPPGEPPPPATEAPKKKKSGLGAIAVGALFGAFAGGIAGGIPGAVVGAAGGAVIGKVVKP